MTSEPGHTVAIVAIGRNEGERLKSCLRAAVGFARTVVYVDSGSTDGSAEFARGLGCHLVEMKPPFSAARARNEGFACAMSFERDAAFVQFVDGDCTLVAGWLERGMAALNERMDVGVVCGHVREIHPEASVYNRLFDLEWRQRPGEIKACGGIFMVRPVVFRAVGGFRPDVIAAEDNEFCVRVRRMDEKIVLLDTAMVWHGRGDAAVCGVVAQGTAHGPCVRAGSRFAREKQGTLLRGGVPQSMDLGAGASGGCAGIGAVNAGVGAVAAGGTSAAICADCFAREKAWMAGRGRCGLWVLHRA